MMIMSKIYYTLKHEAHLLSIDALGIDPELDVEDKIQTPVEKTWNVWTLSSDEIIDFVKQNY
jgi:hypothetical protein